MNVLREIASYRRRDDGTVLGQSWRIDLTDGRSLEFNDQPTDDEIIEVAMGSGRELVPSKRIHLLNLVQERANEWLAVKLLIDDIAAKGEATTGQITKARESAEDVLRARAKEALVRLIQAVA